MANQGGIPLIEELLLLPNGAVSSGGQSVIRCCHCFWPLCETSTPALEGLGEIHSSDLSAMSTPPKRTFIILTPGFPADESDVNCLPSHQNFVKALLRYSDGLNVIVVTFQYPYRAGEYRWHGAKVISINKNRIMKPFRFMVWLHAYRKIKRVTQAEEIVGILSLWCLEEAFVGRLVSLFNAVPFKAWICGQDAKKNNKWIRLIRPKPAHLIGNSNFVTETFFNNHGIRPAHIVPNAINPDDFSGSPQERTIDVIGVGSLIPLKQFSVFLEIIARIPFPIKAVLLGTGPEEQQLKEMAKDLQIESQIEFLGEVAPKQVLQWLGRSKLLLHPSSFEGYSSVCLEALYAGCHVVSFVAAEAHPVANWHIVNTREEMVSKVASLLQSDLQFTSVKLHTVDESARRMLSLFGYTAPSLPD